MEPCAWRLDGNQANLDLDGTVATFDANSPRKGFSLQHAHPSTANAGLLGLVLPQSETSDHQPSPDIRLRGPDLHLSISASEAWPVTIEARWCVTPLQDIAAVPCQVDLILTATTDRLAATPTMHVCSSLPTTDSFQRSNATDGPWLATGDASNSPHSGATLLRIEDSDLSYLEMIHPRDLVRDTLKVSATDASTELQHEIFSGTLEKGVILQARIRGLLLPRADDLQSAETHYQAFLKSELRLAH